MYSTLAVSKHSKASGQLYGTHQQLDRIARKLLAKTYPRKVTKLPSVKMILHFEGSNGPDALKTKSPGVDEPMHFIIPDHDDGNLIQLIRDHHYNLKHAIEKEDMVRAAFEAAWLAHAITDGLTPAHHFPLQEATNHLMTEKEFFKVFGVPLKGIMHGKNIRETLKNNWVYWSTDGYMTKHVAFESGIVLMMTSLPERSITPKLTQKDLNTKDIDQIFYNALAKIAALHMYDEFLQFGWTARLIKETRDVLLPEIIKAIALSWNSVL